MSKSLKFITTTAIGIALYVALSMTAKIPLVGHISLDLGYIVLAVYCYLYGPISGAIVGGAGCVFVSLISSGWFPPGWLLGNIIIGLACGKLFSENKCVKNTLVAVVAVLGGILVVKTTIECVLYAIPVAVKIPKNLTAAIADAVVMSIGVWFAPKLEKYRL